MTVEERLEALEAAVLTLKADIAMVLVQIQQLQHPSSAAMPASSAQNVGAQASESAPQLQQEPEIKSTL